MAVANLSPSIVLQLDTKTQDACCAQARFWFVVVESLCFSAAAVGFVPWVTSVPAMRRNDQEAVALSAHLFCFTSTGSLDGRSWDQDQHLLRSSNKKNLLEKHT